MAAQDATNGREPVQTWGSDLQEQRWAEGQDPVEAPELPVRHQDVDPRVDTEATGKEVASGDLVRTGNLELDPFDAECDRPALDVQQNLGEILWFHGLDRSRPALPDEGEPHHLPVAEVQVALPVLE